MVMLIKDSLSTWREEHPLSALLGTLAEHSNDKLLLDGCIRWLCGHCDRSVGVQQWVAANKQRLQEILREGGWDRRKAEMATLQPQEFLRQHAPK